MLWTKIFPNVINAAADGKGIVSMTSDFVEAFKLCLRLSSRRSRLNGLDAAQKAPVDKDGQVVPPELKQTILMTGRATPVINRFGSTLEANGILLQTNGGNVIEGNFIGTDVTGTTVLPNTGVAGVFVSNVPNNTIGGTTAETRNVLSGNGDGCDNSRLVIWISYLDENARLPLLRN